MLFPLKKALLKPAVALSLVLVLMFSLSAPAYAARSGGRIGGGSFRAPSRSYSAPGRGYNSGARGYGGGIGFPLIFPFFGFGGLGGIMGIIVIIAVANVLMTALRGSGSGATASLDSDNPPVSVLAIQVGLLANARSLKTELDDLAYKANTGTQEGRVVVLQEASLALLRHPEYWIYGSSESHQTQLNEAEAQFNQLSLTERSKFTTETLTNINNQLRQSEQAALPGEAETLAAISGGGGDYILVTLLVAALGNWQLPVVNDSADLRQSLQTVGSLGGDRLLAIEVLWTPQSEGDTLTSDDIIAEYPNLKLV